MLMTDLRVSKNKKNCLQQEQFLLLLFFSIHVVCVSIVLTNKNYSSHIWERKLRFFKLFECKFYEIYQKTSKSSWKKHQQMSESEKKKKNQLIGETWGRSAHARIQCQSAVSLFLYFYFFTSRKSSRLRVLYLNFSSLLKIKTQSSSFFILYFWRCCGTHALTD